MSSSRNGSAAPRDPLAKGLRGVSPALGGPQLLAPGRMNRMIGVRDDAQSRALMRIVGMREVAAGMGIFSRRRPVGGGWARGAGDAMDLALLASALRGRSDSPVKTIAASVPVAGAF